MFQSGAVGLADCRTPHGVRGLKFNPHPRHNQVFRRTPHGVRGLKFRVITALPP